MSIERARTALQAFGLETQIRTFTVSSATVELAAQALGCEGARIAKTLSFAVEGACVLIVAAGDAKIDNAKFKAQFHTKASMLPPAEVEIRTGHAVGGVCPFGVPDDVSVYLDISLRRFTTVYPAAGSSNSAIELTIPQLETCARSQGWIDVCKNWQETVETM